MSVSSPAQGCRELAYRAADGLEVVLLWHQPSNGVMVTLSDTRTGDYFEFDVPPDEALKGFHHPYAYAVARTLPQGTEPLPCWPKNPARTPAEDQSRSPERPR
jgi:hypothetical protein